MHSLRSGAAARAARGGLFALLALVVAACGGGGDGGTDAQRPVIASVNPSPILQWESDFTLTVNGSGFAQGAVVRWNGSDRPTAYVSATQLTAGILNEDVHQAGPAQVVVSNPGGGASAPLSVVVQSRVPRIVATQPEQVIRGTGAFTLRVFGDALSQGSVVRWNGADRPTTFNHAGQLSAQISNADISQAGMAQVTVFTPAPGGGLSNVIELPVQTPPSPAAVVTGMTPDTLVAGVGGTITVTGNWFRPDTRVQIAAMGPGFLPATIVSQTELRFTLTPGNMPEPGSTLVSITNPPPGGGGAAVRLDIVNPRPTITSLSPARANLGQQGQRVRITGTGFTRLSYVRFDDEGRIPTYISPTELEVEFLPRDLDELGTFVVTVSNFSPGGGESNPLDFTVVNPAAP